MDSQSSNITIPAPSSQPVVTVSGSTQPSTTKETKVKIRRPRQPKAETSKKDKTIKIKLTAKGNNAAHNHTEYHGNNANGGSEEEDDPETAIEEHMIFRVPPGELCDKLHDIAKKREFPDDVKLNFKETRKGQFFFDGRKYDVALVDLPTVIESQKTLDKKQFYKVADISQMVLVDPTSGSEPFIPQSNGRHETDPYSFPHGLTPPLKHVRQRRFRKKLSKRAIEEVEKEVERLLEVDATAEDVQYEVVDNRDMENDHEMLSDAGTQDQDIDIDDSGEDESESDDELVADIEGMLDHEESNNDEEEEEDEEEDESDEDEDEDEDEEEDEDGAQTGEIEQKRQEIAELKQAIQKKTDNLSTVPNAMLKNRFETDINNLKKSLALKEAHLAEMNEKEKGNE